MNDISKRVTWLIGTILFVVIVLSVIAGSAQTLFTATGNLTYVNETTNEMGGRLPLSGLLGGSVVLLIIMAFAIVMIVKKLKTK